MSVVALIPAFNEEESIREVIIATQKYVDRVIVCDDGSTDNTLDVLNSMDVTVLTHENNRGYGASLISLFNYCFESGVIYAVTVDADAQHDPEYIPDLLLPLRSDEADIVIGSRFMLGNDDQAPWIKVQGIKTLNKMLEWSTGLRLSDSQSGYRAYNISKLESIQLQDSGMGISTEILIKAKQFGLNIVERPVKISHYDKLELIPLLRHGFNVFQSTIKTMYARNED